MFAIRFLPLPKRVVDFASAAAPAELRVGADVEPLLCPLDHWDRSGYELQWRNAIERVLYRGTSCLITAAYPQGDNNAWEYWPMWVIDGILRVRQSLRPHPPFAPTPGDDSLYDWVGHYRLSGDLSEWSVSVADVERFNEDLKQDA